MVTFKNLIHRGGKESGCRSKSKGRCSLIYLHKYSFDRCKAKHVNPDMRRCVTLSVHASPLAARSCARPSLCDVFVSTKLVQAEKSLNVIQEVTG
jgi:hypothetical protein